MANFNKIFIDANTLHKKSVLLASKILDDGFKPDYIIALWRGGSPVGIYVQEFFNYMGVDAHHAPLKVNLYDNKFMNMKRKFVRTPAFKNLVGRIVINHKIKNILIVDDIFDTGLTTETVKKAFRHYDVRVAVTYYKEGNSPDELKPDYYAEKIPGSTWPVFAHELMDLKNGELKNKNEWITDIVNGVKK